MLQQKGVRTFDDSRLLFMLQQYPDHGGLRHERMDTTAYLPKCWTFHRLLEKARAVMIVDRLDAGLDVCLAKGRRIGRQIAALGVPAHTQATGITGCSRVEVVDGVALGWYDGIGRLVKILFPAD